MRNLLRVSLALACAAVLLSRAAAQPPARPADDPKAKDNSNAPIVVRMMAFDKKKDGKLTRDEITDDRLLRLFDQADTNKDGVVTKDELIALAAKLDADAPRRGGPGDRPSLGGPDGPPGPGGPGDPGHFGPPRPGQILPPFMADALKLTDDQQKQLDALQKDVDARLDKILTEDQKKQMKEMRPPRGPGGPGGPDGPPPPPPPGGPDRPGLDRDRPPADRPGPGPADRPPPPSRDNPPPPRGDRPPPGPGDRDNPPPPPGGPDGLPGPGGPGRFGPPRPGQILPPFMLDALKLTDAQKKQLDDLQKDVDTRLDKILTDDQKNQMKEMRPPRGPGGPGRPGGPGGPDGPPPPPPPPPGRPGPDRDRPNPDR